MCAVCAHVHSGMGTEAREILSALFPETGSFTECGAKLWLASFLSLPSPLTLQSLGLQEPALYVEAEDLNSDLHVCTASSLSH